MDNSHTHVTVKRIEKIPSQYYAPEIKPRAVKNKKVAVQINSSLLAEHRRLSDALYAVPALGKDFSGTRIANIKDFLFRFRERSFGVFKNLHYYLLENAKKLIFSVSVSAGVATMACVILMCTCSLAYTVTINGQEIGTIKSKSDYEAVLRAINTEIGYVTGEDFAVKAEPVFSGKLIKKGDFTPKEALQEQIKATSPEMLPAYGVFVNDEIIFSLPNKTMALSVLESYKEQFTADKTDVTASFCEDVTVAYRFVPKSSLKTPESAALTLEKGRIAVHKTKEGETLDAIAAQYDITVQDLLAVNPIADAVGSLPDSLTLQTGKPLISVKTVELCNFNESIPFATVENEDPTQYEGRITVEQEGSEGERAVMAYITCINGVESERSVVSENLLCAPVEEIVTKGTKEPPSPIGTGELVTPTAAGSLSSRFGSRWGRQHQGIDLAAATGTEIYAADNGTVIYSKYNDGGYGYMLQIDHGNGIVTYYAHCNELLVPEGAVVGKGDLVARVGNTGRSTGAHLHFEVRKNGEPIDPLNYLKELS